MAPVVVIAGRFPPGTTVRLVKVTSVFHRTPLDPVVDERVVDENGVVTFDEGIQWPGTWGNRYHWYSALAPHEYLLGHYWAIGTGDGDPLTIRCSSVNDAEPVPQPPLGADRERRVVAPARTCTLLTQAQHDRERGYDNDSLYQAPNANCQCPLCAADRDAA